MSLALNDIPLAVIVTDSNLTIHTLNKAAEDLVEYIENDLVDKPLSQVLRYCSDSFHETEEPHKDNHSWLTTKSGEVIHLVVTKQSIDNYQYFYLLKRTNPPEEHTQAIQESTRNALEALDETYWEWDLASDLIYHSSELMALLGYKKLSKTVTSDFWEKHIVSSGWQRFSGKIGKLIRHEITKYNDTIQVRTVDDSLMWFNVSAQALLDENQRTIKLYGVVRNVTETKSLIKQLRKQNNYLSMAEKISNSGHWRYDIKTEKMFWSTELYRIFGTDPQSYTPSLENELDFHTEENRDYIRTEFQNSIKNAEVYYNKSTIISASGKKTKIETIGEVEVNSNGDVVALFGICRDITRSETIFEKLKLLAMVNYSIKVPIFFINEEDNVVYQELSPQKGPDNTALFNYINFSISEYLELKKIAKENGQLKRTNISFDNFNSVYDLSVTYESGEGIYIWIVENITSKFRKEQQQAISNRLALLGNTFGSVSHDINNVLGVALGSIEMLELKSMQGEQDLSRYIDRVKNAIDKGKSVTERLLAFTRQPVVKVVDFDPIKEIADNKYLFQQMLISTIKLTINLPQEHCTITFPQGEFINILLNLVLNSQDAIKEEGLNGKIHMSVNYKDTNRLEIHVFDSGVGIETENLTKVFDPFYSSKSVNKGNGIGLANVYSTLYKHNSIVNVEGKSDLGGAHFTIEIPCKRDYKVQAKTNVPNSFSTLKNSRVLILDDEESIAEFVALFLETTGAITVHVASKKQLFEVLDNKQPFDIFITDMVMPDLSGREAVEVVKERYPNIKIFTMSGYIDSGHEDWPYPVLRKPFNSTELSSFLTINN